MLAYWPNDFFLNETCDVWVTKRSKLCKISGLGFREVPSYVISTILLGDPDPIV